MSTPTSQPLGVAVIGHSFMGKAHSNAWRNVGAFYPEAPPARQAVLVGRDPLRTKEAAARYGWAEAATSWESVLERDDVHVVDICTPGESHHDIAVAALAAGKHVLVEKPLSNTVAESESMTRAAAEAATRGVHSMVGFNYRRVPALALARQLVEQGRIGEVRQVRASYLQDWLTDPTAPMTWRLRRESAGSGALGDLASHVIDQVQHITASTVTGVNGRLHTFVAERDGDAGREAVTVDDAAWATCVLSSGAIASIEVSRVAAGRKNGLSLEVFGSEGSLSFDLERLNELGVHEEHGEHAGLRRVLVTEESHPYLQAWWPPGHVLGWDATFTMQAADFLGAIAADRAPSPSFAEGLAVQRVLAAVEQSARHLGTCVDVPAEDPLEGGRA
ncbi:Gfo/Idh/MocA family oxidoreductase [Nocardioides nanhaiensis]